MREEGKILSPQALRDKREELRGRGLVVVQCHGCFDIVHPGHIRYLRFAKEQGDVLMVSVSADAVVGKGADRPYISEELRLENLAALECVDYVCLDENSWGGPILELLRPDVYVKGKEYESSNDPRFARERELVESYGGKVVFSSGRVVYSSTYILDKFSHRFQLENEKIVAFCARHGVTRPLIDEVLQRFLGRKLLILGDPILDHYVHCDALSIASESPVLNVTPIREDWYLGAAAVMARQAVHLGAEATLVTLLGRGVESERFTAAMDQAGIRLIAVGEDDRPVYVKTRYLVDDAKVFKVNTGRYAPPSSLAMRELVRRLEDLLGEHDAVVAPDFGYGLFSGDLVAGLERISRAHGKPYFVDVSTNGANILKFKRPRLASPTEEELRFAFADQESGLSHLASCYYAETEAEQLVLTLGKKGAVHFGPPEPDQTRLRTEYLPALTHHPIDPVGAGDVFTILLALADLSGASPPVGLYLASCIAALQVSNLGNDPPDLLDLRSFLNERPELVAEPAGG